MSFGATRCSQCHFGFPLAPIFYCISENRQIMVQTYPCGEREYSDVYNSPPHESLFHNPFLDLKDDSGQKLCPLLSITTIVCDTCTGVKYRGTSRSFPCQQCESGTCYSWDSYLSKVCPKCHEGTIIELPPDPTIHF